MDKQKQIEQYILDHIGKEDEVLKELDRYTHVNVLWARMISGHLQGKVLTMLSNMISPVNILEIGTFTGYSAICLARGLQKGGKLVTVEIDDQLKKIASEFFTKAKLTDRIEQRIGPALEIIPKLEQTFDLVFLDADKREYMDYYNAVFPKIRTGGYIIADNTLWSGRVLEDLKNADEQTRGIMEFNYLINNDERVEKVILPLRDGMTLIRKR